MYKYDILYRSVNNSWLIIVKDPNDDYWYVFQDGITDEHTAKLIRDAMNLAVNQ